MLQPERHQTWKEFQQPKQQTLQDVWEEILVLIALEEDIKALEELKSR